MLPKPWGDVPLEPPLLYDTLCADWGQDPLPPGVDSRIQQILDEAGELEIALDGVKGRGIEARARVGAEVNIGVKRLRTRLNNLGTTAYGVWIATQTLDAIRRRIYVECLGMNPWDLKFL